jgi:hypothetical protein
MACHFSAVVAAEMDVILAEDGIHCVTLGCKLHQYTSTRYDDSSLGYKLHKVTWRAIAKASDDVTIVKPNTNTYHFASPCSHHLAPTALPSMHETMWSLHLWFLLFISRLKE